MIKINYLVIEHLQGQTGHLSGFLSQWCVDDLRKLIDLLDDKVASVALHGCVGVGVHAHASVL